ncbi:hypothetical protein NAV33_03105 [Pseudomonas stutzeri]|uniref:hypothetical protein n=1 Tax=Stutzerimonas stutzeri TaxID=316 RepID=UPI00210B875B|nr:hypothetical protein [Stutzerimonas stutzeri]MCQ4310890.1 hypothetical protein [Stutzerimonas stutzeri]
MEQEDWDALKAQMDSPWGQMTLQCDEYELTLQQQTANKSWSTAVYVNGVFKGAWMHSTRDGQPVHEEARRFLRKSTQALYSRKEIELTRKAFGKREAAKREATKIIFFQPTWKSFASLKKQLLAHNTTIKRIH